MPVLRLLAVAALAPVLCAPLAAAQPLGTFAWQLQPFCNRVTVNVTQQGSLFTIDGFDDQCGAGQRAPLVGVGTPNPDGTIGLGLHVITVPGGRSVDVDARLSLASLTGPWQDSAGNSGTFAFNGQSAGSPRPLPAIPGLLIAPGSITSTSLANGSVTPQKLSVPMPQLRSSGLTTAAVTLTSGLNIVVRSLTMNVPAAGQVLVDASGLFGIAPGLFEQTAWCSISTGATVETAHYLYARATITSGGYNTVTNVPFGGSRVYSVTAGMAFTANLVCLGSTSSAGFQPTVQTAQLNALFVPD